MDTLIIEMILASGFLTTKEGCRVDHMCRGGRDSRKWHERRFLLTKESIPYMGYYNVECIYISYFPTTSHIELPSTAKYIFIECNDQGSSDLNNIIFPDTDHVIHFVIGKESSCVILHANYIKWREGLISIFADDDITMVIPSDLKWPSTLLHLENIMMVPSYDDFMVPFTDLMDGPYLRINAENLKVLKFRKSYIGCFRLVCPKSLLCLRVPICIDMDIKWNNCLEKLDLRNLNYTARREIVRIPENLSRLIIPVDTIFPSELKRIEKLTLCRSFDPIEINLDINHLLVDNLEYRYEIGPSNYVPLSVKKLTLKENVYRVLHGFTCDEYNWDRVLVPKLITMVKNNKNLRTLMLDINCKAKNLQLWDLPDTLENIDLYCEWGCVLPSYTFDLTTSSLPSSLKNFSVVCGIIPKANWPPGFKNLYIGLYELKMDVSITNVKEWRDDIRIHIDFVKIDIYNETNTNFDFLVLSPSEFYTRFVQKPMKIHRKLNFGDTVGKVVVDIIRDKNPRVSTRSFIEK